jgi:hypothetical protein
MLLRTEILTCLFGPPDCQGAARRRPRPQAGAPAWPPARGRGTRLMACRAPRPAWPAGRSIAVGWERANPRGKPAWAGGGAEPMRPCGLGPRAGVPLAGHDHP